MTRVLRFDGERLLAAEDPLRDGDSPDLADSFLFRSGRIRARDEHRNRFFHDLHQINPTLANQLDAFYHACAQELSDEYEAFPRFDLVNNSLWLRVRPAPDRSLTVEARSVPQSFENAQRKGPNIAAYSAINREHQCEVIRLTPQGLVLEGVTSSLLWWHDDQLCFAPTHDRVTSTTETFLIRTAHARGIHTGSESITPTDLSGREVWAVNALHGIRLVTSIDGRGLPDCIQERIALFRADFEASWLPLDNTGSANL
jgi:branched-subunit amino acid aminotransferase/4-amino-4-deoxychorismate lyase